MDYKFLNKVVDQIVSETKYEYRTKIFNKIQKKKKLIL
jgi:hypothetical protein